MTGRFSTGCGSRPFPFLTFDQVFHPIKPQAHQHARAITLDRGVKKLFQFGEGDDVIELFPEFFFRNAENRAIE